MSQLRCVADVMTRDPIAMHEEDDVWEVQQEMSNLGLRHLPVVDGGKLVGLLTSQHLLAFSVSRRSRDSLHQHLDSRRKQGTFVADIMERDLVTVSPDTSLRRAAELMGNRKIGCLPVVEGDRLVGIVTESDLMELLVTLLPAGGEPASGAP